MQHVFCILSILSLQTYPPSTIQHAPAPRAHIGIQKLELVVSSIMITTRRGPPTVLVQLIVVASTFANVTTTPTKTLANTTFRCNNPHFRPSPYESRPRRMEIDEIRADSPRLVALGTGAM